MKRLFGTDGIRAVAGSYPLDAPSVRRFGAAMARVLRGDGDQPGRFVLGRDTRESGPWLRDAVAAGLASGDAEAVDAGVITTPGLAHALRSGAFDAGVMISASHNPFEDNGLKAFGPDGCKLADEVERQVETLILEGPLDDPGDKQLAIGRDDALLSGYVEFLRGVVAAPMRFQGIRMVLDCANGAACAIAPDLFRRLGAEVLSLADSPNGKNINLDCGSLHLDSLAERVRDVGYDIGLAFDGDADRCLAVDRTGRVVDGDHILFIIGRRMKREGRLHGDGLVATIMSNFWLEDRLDREGVRLTRAPVGDKYVRERMIADDLVLGGEQSGHIIFRDLASTGDGILTGLLLIDSLLVEGQPLHEIMGGIVPYPQVLLNVRVREKPDLMGHPRIGPAVSKIVNALDGEGRVVLRYSGTEPLARVMLEGKDADRVREFAEQLAGLIQHELGA